MKPCTSNYAVEARASAWESAAKSLRTPAHKSVPFGRNVARLLDEAAALLRALVAGRDHWKATFHARYVEDVRDTKDAYARGWREGAEKMRMFNSVSTKAAAEVFRQCGVPDVGRAFDQHGDMLAIAPLPEPQA